MLIPELVLQSTVKSLIDLLQSDWLANSDKTKTILYDLFNKDDNGTLMVLNKFNYFDQARDIFIKNNGESRRLQVVLGYNLERMGLPTVHILLPNESEGDVGIGMGQGYLDPEFDTDSGTYKRNFTNVFNSTYNLMITSDNSSEVVLIYHALKNLFTAVFEHFELMGLRNIKFGGADLQFNNELVPPTVFHRNLSVSFFYESSVNELLTNKIINNFIFTGTIISSENILDSEEASDI